MKKVLILTVSSGDGYNKSARAIVNGIAQRYPSVNFRIVDVFKGNKQMDFLISEEKTMAQKLAHKIERMRYAKSKRTNDEETLRDNVSKYTDAIVDYVKNNIHTYEPDTIICTHIFPAIVLSDLKANGFEPVAKAKKVYVECNYVVSPYTRLCKNMDYYIVPTDDMAKEYKKFGIKDTDKIKAFGIPIISKIENITLKEDARELIKIDKDSHVILLSSGDSNEYGFFNLAKAINAKYPDSMLICVCNKNTKLKDKLNVYVRKNNIKNMTVYGHTNNMAIIMSASDVVLGKTGGVEVAEAIAKQIPYISVLKLKGQDLDNMKYLKQKGAILNGKNKNKVLNALSSIIDDTKAKAKIKKQMEKLYKYNATDELVKFLYKTK